MVLPEGIDRNIVISMLCSELAELELLYPDLETMRIVIGSWSLANLANWNKLLATTELTYNPIENYDRVEEWEDIQTTETDGNIATDNEGNTTTKTASYDNSKLLDTGGGTAKTKGTTTNKSKETATNKRKGRAHGNIGVTTTQQMIEQERNIVKFNIYDYIVDSFKNRFCILVY